MEDSFVRLFHGEDPQMPDPVDVEIVLQTMRMPKELAMMELRGANFDLPAVLRRFSRTCMY